MFSEGEVGSNAFASLFDVQIGAVEETISLAQSANVLRARSLDAQGQLG